MRYALPLLVVAAVSACREPVGEAPPPLSVAFLADRVLPPSPELGGLSALVYSAETGRWLALSDAKIEPRYFELEVTWSASALSVGPSRRIDLEGFPAEAIDPEGLAPSPWGTLFVSSEANLSSLPADQPRLLEFAPDGKWLGSFDVPEKFLASENHGVRHNLAFESLTVTPDGTRLFLGAESALVQDGPAAGIDAVGFCRIVEYAIRSRALVATAEYVYPVGPIAPASELGEADAMGGLVELVALSSTRLLALERIFIRERLDDGASVTRVRLYDVDLEAASNVAEIENLAESDAWRPVTKELLVDFDDIVPRLSPEHPVLDNFEAMAIGPDLGDGDRALVVVSDDNFREQQRTVFLLFRLRGI